HAQRARLAHLHESGGMEVQGFISATTRAFTTRLLEQAIQALGGPPAFAFEAVTLGSTSRGEASPYSDIEFAFVLPEATSDDEVAQASAYRQAVAQLMRAQVSALGEFGAFGLPERLHWDPVGLSPAEDPERFIGRPSDLVRTGFDTDA